jgi:hypothetical protein
VASTLPERFTILAPSDKKADIIMAYVRDFATQHRIISSQLELDKNDTLDRLRRERAKKHITFKRGGGVQTLTLDARNSKRNIEAAMGFGSKNIIEDEASLIEDTLHSTVMRMLGGYDYDKSFLLKIGNPFYNNHFRKSADNPKYNRIHLTYLDSLKDRGAGFHGFDPEFIEEMRQEALFDVFYECLFPREDEIDRDGYRQLLTLSDIKEGIVDRSLISKIAKLGCDIGGGGDLNVYTIRIPGVGAFVVGSNRSRDTMTNVVEIENIVEKFGLFWSNVNIDDIGIGRGVTDRLKEKGYGVNGISVGGASKMPDKYMNLRAELFWEMGLELKRPEFVVEMDKKGVEQLSWIRFKVNSDKQIKIEPKEDLKKRTGKSPDFAESLMLTFYEPRFIGFV